MVHAFVVDDNIFPEVVVVVVVVVAVVALWGCGAVGLTNALRGQKIVGL